VFFIKIYKSIKYSFQESNLTEEAARRARVVMDNYRIEETQPCTLAATKMYKWVSQLI
jgi:hypothetical protein